MSKQNKYKVQVREILLIDRTYEVTAQDEDEAKAKVRRRQWDELLSDVLVSRSEPMSFKITPLEDK